jgi:hypothetical protein
MNSTSLRQIIKESIQEYIREVETSGNVAAQEAKIRACDEAIALREKKLNMEGLDEAYHDMIDEAKKKNLEKEIKELQKYKKKAEKILEKMKSKAGKEDTMENEDMGEEAVIDEVAIDEMDPEAGPQLEEAKKKKAAKKEKEEKEMMNESFLYMQKLAGIITESEYKEKIKEAEEVSISDSDMEKIKNLPAVKQMAAKVAKNPKAMKDLEDIITKAGISLEEAMGEIGGADAEKIAKAIAPMLKEDDQEIGGGDAILGGGSLGALTAFIPGALSAVNSVLGLAAFSIGGGVALVAVGALLGAVYAIVKGLD